jgi:hypothetical protein
MKWLERYLSRVRAVEKENHYVGMKFRRVGGLLVLGSLLQAIFLIYTVNKYVEYK